MAKKAKTVFVCQSCGYESPRWMGKCICGAWNSFVEEKILPDSKDDMRQRVKADGKAPKPISITEITKDGNYERLDSGIGELNRVLGGGIVKGSLTLISGEPGIGKSTIIMQCANYIANTYGKVLYVSGEESEEQIKLRGSRICKKLSKDLLLLSETNMENIGDIVEELSPSLIIIDSIQTMYTQSIDSASGSVSQVRACGNMLMRIGKTTNIPVFIVAHVTKSGELAGPKILEHLVDTVLNFSGERNQELRVIRSFKNRFGTTSEIGAFKMEEEGLIEMDNISASFLEEREEQPEGSMITSTYEGSRPLLLEIQGLTAPANIGFARRTTVGVDQNRLNMILAVLEKKAGLKLLNQDVYVNVVGGLKLDSTCTDLSVALAIFSSYKGIPAPAPTIALGEIGLTGEVRGIPNCSKIILEAERMGYRRFIIPYKNYLEMKKSPFIKNLQSCKIIAVRTLEGAIKNFQK